MKFMDLSGEYKLLIDGKIRNVNLPGTLDENCVGERELTAEKWHPDAATEAVDTDVITTRFTRKHAYEGEVCFTRSFPFDKLEEKRYFVKVERARQLGFIFNGEHVAEYEKGTLSTPYEFEVTDLLKKENEIVFISSNTYKGLPVQSIKYSSAATNETQTNWNGLLGKIRLEERCSSFIKSVRVYPGETHLDVTVEIDSIEDCIAGLCLKSDATDSVSRDVELHKGINKIQFCNVPYKPHVKKWDEYEGNLYSMTVSSQLHEPMCVNFGIRTFSDDGKGHLSLNGRRIFLRSEANCCVFASSGHMPMAKDEWKKHFLLYKEYGVNCVRFHSHCPPEAAFVAADELGMLVQPELSNWDPQNALESDESLDYYTAELKSILETYANHPSFCMLTMGNELQAGNIGLERLAALVEWAQKADSTRLYAIASNAFYGQKGADDNSDFYTASNYYNCMLRGTNAGLEGHINNQYPNTLRDYCDTMEQIRKVYKKPVFSFEVGQYEVLPDFKELEKFSGVLDGTNLEYIRQKVKEKGFLQKWEKWVEASGELSLIAYREEVEAVLRTEQMSGISLLGLQDFPGQGTALVGMINSHFEPKPYDFAKPANFRAFFTDCLPLVKMDSYTFTVNASLDFNLCFANYSKEDAGGRITYSLDGVGEFCGKEVVCKKGGLTELGSYTIPLNKIKTSGKYMLRVRVGDIENKYPVWIYTDEGYEVENVHICRAVDEARIYLDKGENVLLSPPATEEEFPCSIKTHFTTDFWSCVTFPSQSGFMGICVDPEHPVFNKFPTDSHSDYQWWPLTNSRAMILPDYIDPLFDVMDSFVKLRKLGFLLEAKCGNGKVILSSMGLLEKMQYPSVRAMAESICKYMESDKFNPVQSLSIEQLRGFMKGF